MTRFASPESVSTLFSRNCSMASYCGLTSVKKGAKMTRFASPESESTLFSRNCSVASYCGLSLGRDQSIYKVG